MISLSERSPMFGAPTAVTAQFFLSLRDQGANADDRVIDELGKLVAHLRADFVVEPTNQPICCCEAAQIGNGLDIPYDDAGWHGSDPDEALASVLAAIESGERVGAGLEAARDVLLAAQLARAHPVRQRRHRGFPAVHVIQDHEPLRASA